MFNCAPVVYGACNRIFNLIWYNDTLCIQHLCTILFEVVSVRQDYIGKTSSSVLLLYYHGVRGFFVITAYWLSSIKRTASNSIQHSLTTKTLAPTSHRLICSTTMCQCTLLYHDLENIKSPLVKGIKLWQFKYSYIPWKCILHQMSHSVFEP